MIVTGHWHQGLKPRQQNLNQRGLTPLMAALTPLMARKEVMLVISSL
jgi:hypothetical protein